MSKVAENWAKLKEFRKRGSMADDKVHGLAEQLTINIYPGLSEDWAEFRKLLGENERIIRAELKPLLDAAREVLNDSGTVPLYTKTMKALLAAELRNWSKP